jgi:hypothetical protein
VVKASRRKCKLKLNAARLDEASQVLAVLIDKETFYENAGEGAPQRCSYPWFSKQQNENVSIAGN